MKCDCGAYVSGDSCKNCGRLLTEKPKKSKKIKNRSDKGKAEDLVYKALRLKFLRENPRCAVYPELKATEVHHKRGRGEYYLDVSTWLPVSHDAHLKITNNHEWALENGYSEERLKNYNQ
jgi:hypothetical protein